MTILARLLCLAAALAVSGIAPADTLLVVRKTDSALDFVDPGSGVRLASVKLGHAPHEVSVAPDGQRAAVTNYGTGEQPGSTLSIVDLAQPAETKRIDLAPHTRPHGVAWYAPDRIAVTTEGSKSLVIVDPDAGRIVNAIGTDQEISHMVAVSADGMRAYVANIGSGTTTVIDLEQGRKVADVATGKGSEGLALTRDGRELWVGARAEDRISVVDTTTLSVVATLPAAGIPIRVAMSPDGSRAYVTGAGASTVTAFDVATRSPVRTHRVEIPLAPGAAQRPFARLAPGSALPVGLTTSPASGAVYVAATMGDKVLVVGPEDLSPVHIVDVGGEPDGLGVTATIPKAPCHGCKPAP